MSWNAVRKTIGGLVPEALLLGGAAACVHLDALRGRTEEFAAFYPWAVFALGFLLALRFQRSRLVFALLLLAFVGWGLDHAPEGPARRFVFHATAALLPLNLAAIALLRERGLFTRAGLVRLGLLLAQVGGVALAVRHALEPATAVVRHPVLPVDWVAWTPLSQLPVLAFLAAATALVVATIVFAPRPMGRAFIWALASTFLAFHFAPMPAAMVVYGSTAALILVVVVIEASHTMAYQDGLTGLPARRALTEALQQMNGEFTVAMVDVDHFKKLNDRYGHDVGDQVLRMVAGQLARVNGGGRAFRYGGEEFALLFPGRGAADCRPELERLRRAVQQARFTVRRHLRRRRKPAATESRADGRQQISVTVSIGAAEPNGRGGSVDDVVKAADRALYRAKNGGRNRVES